MLMELARVAVVKSGGHNKDILLEGQGSKIRPQRNQQIIRATTICCHCVICNTLTKSDTRMLGWPEAYQQRQRKQRQFLLTNTFPHGFSSIYFLFFLKNFRMWILHFCTIVNVFLHCINQCIVFDILIGWTVGQCLFPI